MHIIIEAANTTVTKDCESIDELCMAIRAAAQMWKETEIYVTIKTHLKGNL